MKRNYDPISHSSNPTTVRLRRAVSNCFSSIIFPLFTENVKQTEKLKEQFNEQPLTFAYIQLLILVILEFMNTLCTCKLGTHHIFYLDTHYTHETLLQSEYLHTHISLVAIWKNDSRAHFSINSGTTVS